MNQLQEIAQLVKEMVGTQYLYFSTPLVVKMSPHDFHTVSFWGVCTSPAGDVYVMDNNQEWYRVEEEPLIQSLYQRVSIMSKQYKAA